MISGGYLSLPQPLPEGEELSDRHYLFFQCFQFIVPAASIAICFGFISDIGSAFFVRVRVETNLPVFTAQLINLIFILRVFHIKFFTTANGTCGFSHG
jgi:hypothetical protein